MPILFPGAMETKISPCPRGKLQPPGRVDGDPDQQMEPSPQHEVEQSRGPVQEKQERLASVEVEANEQFVLSTTWSATESSPGGHGLYAAPVRVYVRVHLHI